MSNSARGSKGLIVPALMATGLILSACDGGEPFVDFYPIQEKTGIPLKGTRLTPAICFSGDDPKSSEIRALASAHCAELGQVARYSKMSRFQCTPRTPHVAYYSCVVPPYKPSPGKATVQPGRIDIPPPAWEPGAVPPPPPTTPRGDPTNTPWDPTAAPSPAPSTEEEPNQTAPAGPSWDEGTTGGRGAFPTNAITNLPSL